MNRTAVSAFAIAGWSGFYVMLVELLSSRLLAPFFGSSIYVWGAIIVVFMLGLAVGYLLGGLFSRHKATVRRLCALQAASALATIPTLMFGEQVSGWLFDTGIDVRYGSPLGLHGAVLPADGLRRHGLALCVGFYRQEPGNQRPHGGLSLLRLHHGLERGTLLTSFYFVLWWEVNTIFIGAIAASLALCAGVALIAGAKRKRPSHEDASSRPWPQAWPSSAAFPPARRRRSCCTRSARSTATSGSSRKGPSGA